jgi:hypothetical protein
MSKQIGCFFTSVILIWVVAVPGVAVQRDSPRVAALQSSGATLAGRWRVKFALSGGSEKNLILDSQANGVATFRLLDTGPDDKPVVAPQPAAWSQLTNARVSFSGEVELPLGTCCRELGTLMFKGKFSSSNSISGKLVFVTSTDEEESPYKFHSLVGTFTATRVSDNGPGTR